MPPNSLMELWTRTMRGKWASPDGERLGGKVGSVKVVQGQCFFPIVYPQVPKEWVSFFEPGSQQFSLVNFSNMVLFLKRNRIIFFQNIPWPH